MAQNRDLPVLLIGMKASTNFGSDFKKEFDSIYDRLRTEYDIFFYENFFKAITTEDVSLFLSFMQSDGIHPNASGIEKIVEDLFPTFENFINHVLKKN